MKQNSVWSDFSEAEQIIQFEIKFFFLLSSPINYYKTASGPKPYRLEASGQNYPTVLDFSTF